MKSFRIGFMIMQMIKQDQQFQFFFQFKDFIHSLYLKYVSPIDLYQKKKLTSPSNTYQFTHFNFSLNFRFTF